jgi:hypothetical protein
LPLRIQEVLVDQHVDIPDTDAGELNLKINAQVRKHEEVMRSLEERVKQAMKDKGEEARGGLEIEMQRMQKEIKRFQHDSERLEYDCKKETERLAERMERMESQAREEADRIAAQLQRHIDEMKNALQTNIEASEREKAGTLQQMRKIWASRRDPGLFQNIERLLDGLIL